MSLTDKWNNTPTNTETIHQSLANAYQTVIQTVTRNEQELLQFLEYSSQLYKYDLESVLFAYGQNPSATFLADFDTWKKLNRPVSKGSKAIKVLHQKENGQFYHVNLFDVQQTTGSDLNFPNWLMTETKYQELMDQTFQSAQNHSDLWDILHEHYESVKEERKTGSWTADELSDISEYMLKYKLGQRPRWKDYAPSVQAFVENPDLFIEIMPEIIQTNQQLLSQLVLLQSFIKTII